jgi:hypothetical protein
MTFLTVQAREVPNKTLTESCELPYGAKLYALGPVWKDLEYLIMEK